MTAEAAKKTNAREALLSAAEELFIEKGYAAVGVREIADAAGVNLGGIQYYFGSKAKLFIETVSIMMGREAHNNPFLSLDRPIHSMQEAANLLVKFIALFLDHLLHPKGPDVCRVIYREIFSELSQDPEMTEALVSSVSNDFYRPSDQLLLRLLREFLPHASEGDLGLYAQSVIGQCTFYVTHKPFVERLRGRDFSKGSAFEEAVTHVATFSLRALGCSKEIITNALTNLMGLSKNKLRSENLSF